MNTIHTNSAVSVVIEVIYQLVQNNNVSPYVISQISHIRMHIHTRIRLSETLPLRHLQKVNLKIINEPHTALNNFIINK